MTTICQASINKKFKSVSSKKYFTNSNIGTQKAKNINCFVFV